MLEKAYFTPTHAGSFTSPHSLRTSLLLKKQKSKKGKPIRVPTSEQIRLWLQEKRPYTLHRPARKNYPMKQVIVGGVNIQLQADLVDMQQLASENDGFRFILLAIDCFSRFAYAQPLKTKQGNLVAEALDSIFNEAEGRIDRKIEKLQSRLMQCKNSMEVKVMSEKILEKQASLVSVYNSYTLIFVGTIDISLHYFFILYNLI